VTSAQSGAAAGVIILKEKKIICFVKSFLYQACEKGAPRCSKYFCDHSTVRFTANSKLAFQAQTLSLRPFRFTRNGYRKNLNPRSELFFPVFQRFLIFSHQGEPGIEIRYYYHPKSGQWPKNMVSIEVGLNKRVGNGG
jgi:hypothetical protein